MEIQVSTHDWLALPMNVRLKLREIFKVPRSSHTLVEGNIVKSDGVTYEDLKAITVEKMTAYLGTDYTGLPDFINLFNATLEKIKEQDKELEPVEKVDPNQMMLEEWAANLQRIQQQASSLGMTEHLITLINKLFPNDNARPQTVPTPATGKRKGRPKKAK